MIAVRSLLERLSPRPDGKRRPSGAKQPRKRDTRPIPTADGAIAPGRRHRVLREFDLELVRDCD